MQKRTLRFYANNLHINPPGRPLLAAHAQEHHTNHEVDGELNFGLLITWSVCLGQCCAIFVLKRAYLFSIYKDWYSSKNIMLISCTYKCLCFIVLGAGYPFYVSDLLHIRLWSVILFMLHDYVKLWLYWFIQESESWVTL